jgi:hypothetical protein
MQKKKKEQGGFKLNSLFWGSQDLESGVFGTNNSPNLCMYLYLQLRTEKSNLQHKMMGG